MSHAGYWAKLPTFLDANPSEVLAALKGYVPDAGESQVRALRDSIRILQQGCGEFLSRATYPESSILMEYTIPLESRRIDVLLLLNGVVVVVEFKSKQNPYQSDIDQAAAYGRDLRAYHAACADFPVVCLLALARVSGKIGAVNDVLVIGRDELVSACETLIKPNEKPPSLTSFLVDEVYQPLPSLI